MDLPLRCVISLVVEALSIPILNLSKGWVVRYVCVVVARGRVKAYQRTLYNQRTVLNRICGNCLNYIYCHVSPLKYWVVQTIAISTSKVRAVTTQTAWVKLII